MLASSRRREAGCREAWLVDGEGIVTEGTSTNAWIVDREGRLVTRPLGHAILGGVTRAASWRSRARTASPSTERPFTVAEAQEAREAFLTSTSSLSCRSSASTATRSANGRPGSITRSLLAAYAHHAGLTPAVAARVTRRRDHNDSLPLEGCASGAELAN